VPLVGAKALKSSSTTSFENSPPNKPMKRTLNSSVQISAVPSGTNHFGLGDLGGAIQRR
jgi:hypothetical protein